MAQKRLVRFFFCKRIMEDLIKFYKTVAFSCCRSVSLNDKHAYKLGTFCLNFDLE
jgi:hypothetical protein